ncbi:MAG TPA: hypothetical protein PKL69_07140, partial [Agitococcus sp.]|nr:hypothetical protein [Agitococcus sp.]
IEHHMFPDVPGMRYAEMSVKVREICERYGQHYNTGSFTKQFSTVVKRIFKYALPFSRKVEDSRAETIVAKAAKVTPITQKTATINSIAA